MISNLTINDIRNKRRHFEAVLERNFKKIYFPYDQQKIIIDALVYLEYKLRKTGSPNGSILKILNIHKNNGYSVNSSLHCKEDVDKFLSELSYMSTVNFQTVIDTYVKVFNPPHNAGFDINSMLKNTEIEQNPEANLAIRIFLLRGNFSWDWFPHTNFSELLKQDLSDVPPNAILNCWEVIMLALFQAKLIDIDTLKKAYSSDVPKNIYKMLRSKNVLTIENLYEKLFKKSCIISFKKLSHVMLNVPFSQKQILRMLITENFDEQPTTSKLFSLWSLWTDGRLGTVPKQNFYSHLSFGMKNTHPVTVHGINLK